jgi:hypothetical protein
VNASQSPCDVIDLLRLDSSLPAVQIVACGAQVQLAVMQCCDKNDDVVLLLLLI